MKRLHPHKIKGWKGIGGQHSAINFSSLRKGLSKSRIKGHKLNSPI